MNRQANVVSVLLCYSDKALSKSTVSEEGVCLSCRVQSTIQGNRVGTKARDLGAGTEVEIQEDFWFLFASLAYSATFLMESRATSSGMILYTVGWALFCQLAIKKSLTDVPTGQSDNDDTCLEIPSSQMCLGSCQTDKNLTSTTGEF